MIDLHSHILPNVDDGAVDWDGTVAMLTMAEEAGTTVIAATPHSHDFWRGFEPAEVMIPGLVQEANRRAVAAGLKIKVLIGQECQAYPDLVRDLDAKKWQTLGESRTILLELPFATWPSHVESLVFDLQLAGYTILLAHPERYRALHDDVSRLAPLIERGVYTQITTTSVMGRNGDKVRDLARQLVDLKWAHVLASDAHSTGNRHTRLDEAAAELARWTNQETAQRFTVETPLALLNDKTPDVPMPLPYEPKRKKILGIF
jgi:protein-tyrosine phosphatase